MIDHYIKDGLNDPDGETAMGKRLSDGPVVAVMGREQRRLAQIGGRPCEWSAAEWARWSEGED